MTPLGLRKRWRGMVRRRLMSLRGRVDRRIERLDERKQALDMRVTARGAEPQPKEPVPVTGPDSGETEVQRLERRDIEYPQYPED